TGHTSAAGSILLSILRRPSSLLFTALLLTPLGGVTGLLFAWSLCGPLVRLAPASGVRRPPLLAPGSPCRVSPWRPPDGLTRTLPRLSASDPAGPPCPATAQAGLPPGRRSPP